MKHSKLYLCVNYVLYVLREMQKDAKDIMDPIDSSQIGREFRMIEIYGKIKVPAGKRQRPRQSVFCGYVCLW